jgi:hypothetical protein
MGLAARRRGAYGGEYMRAGLRLCAQGRRRLGKISSQTRAKEILHMRQQLASEADQKSVPRTVPAFAFYMRPQTCLAVQVSKTSMYVHVT